MNGAESQQLTPPSSSLPSSSSSSSDKRLLYLAAATTATALLVGITFIVRHQNKREGGKSNCPDGKVETNAIAAQAGRRSHLPLFSGKQTANERLRAEVIQLSNTRASDWKVDLIPLGESRHVVKVTPLPYIVQKSKDGDSGGGGDDDDKEGGHSFPESYSIDVEMVEGVPFPPFLPPARFHKLRNNLMLRPGDIIVCTYPKCGTTWTEQIVLLLLHGGDASTLNPTFKNSFRPGGVGKVWAEAALMKEAEDDSSPNLKLIHGESMPIAMEDFENIPGRRVIKSHAPPHLLVGCGEAADQLKAKEMPPLPAGVKAIIATRNAKDACVSAYYHAHNPAKRGWPFPVWAAVYLSGYHPYGSWQKHTEAWMKARDIYPNDIMILSYEDVKADPLVQVRKIAAFLEVPADDDLLQRCVDASDFDVMKKASNNAAHLRKGIVGDWKRHMSVAVSEEFDDRYTLKT